MKLLSAPLQRAIAAAATLTGKRFGLLVASSLVATSAIVATAMTSSSGLGPLAGLLGRSLAADRTPAAVSPAPAPAPAAGSAGAAARPAPSEPSPSPAPETTAVPAPAPATPSNEPETPAAPEAPAPETGPVKHVFVVSLASSGYDAAFGATPAMPYLATTLRPQGDLLSGFSLLAEAAPANSIATVSGQPPNPQTKAGCPTYGEFPAGTKVNANGTLTGSGCVYPVETLTLSDQLGSARLSWRAYVEGMVDESGKPANCVHPEPDAAEAPVPGGYAATLNPFVYFHSLLDLGDCATNDVPIAGLDKDLKKIDSTPSFSYVAPDPCDAGVAGQCPAGSPEGAVAADAFLAETVPKILASPAYEKDGLLIVTFGSANPPAAGATADPLEVGTLLVSPFLSAGATDAAPYTPYSLLRSTEDLFGLAHLGAAGGTKVRSFAQSLVATNGGD